MCIFKMSLNIYEANFSSLSSTVKKKNSFRLHRLVYFVCQSAYHEFYLEQR